jgi:hypothetical protein
MNPLRHLPAPLLIALAVASFAGPAASARANDQIKNVSMTRMMLVVSDLEKNLSSAIAKRDQAATDALLSTDFELRPGDHPGDPTTRADWLADDGSGKLGDLEQLSVHELGDVAIASFIRAVPANDAPTKQSRSFVVDVWRRQGNDWQLVTRYQSALPATDAPTEDVAPTGKG